MSHKTDNEDYFDLGRYTRRVSTANPAAQKWFDRGLVWSYAFNHEEATVCFEKAIAEDPHCLLAYWGVAYTVGPNYNKPWEVFDADEVERNLSKAVEAVQTAKKHESGSNGTPVEVALLDAVQWRYQPNAGTDRSQWNQDYARAMAEVYEQFSDDLDVAALYADSLMNLTPWGLWDLRTGKPAEGARTLEARGILERAIAQNGGHEHPGLLHLYIHLMEMSSAPELALPAADSLRGLVPDGGHLQHMPTHLDVLCGDYRRVIASNADAIRADERWLARAGALNFYSLYRSHNYHFRIYGAMFAGQYGIALQTARMLEASLPPDLLRIESPPMADWLEGFFPMRFHVLVRFGKWNDILALPLPQDEVLYATTTAMTHYAKGIALSALNRVQEAEEQRALFRAAAQAVPASRTVFNNTCTDILAVGSAMLDGELEYRRGNHDLAFQHLRHAIHLSDNLPYDEPWGWMQPPRHAYGALLLEQGRVKEAAGVYTADLGLDDTLPRALQHPNNVWALHGLHECLGKLGREGEARIVKKLLDLTAATADVVVTASCACRTGVVPAEEAARL
ncbi:TPR domain protein [Neohortaea acidophila]|uniref:TPR domain protein n=1 Tax=Neohortaea acidophila TaxID=245834 RepID=A0A6A6PL88_9PEZI|nr:TPR domain protein [Neohortaea acidophila]KAF2480830.1 TPR domain protein [Neohortaea acidophila]